MDFCVGSINGDASRHQREEGGSIPTPTLFHIGLKDECDMLVKKHHYSGRPAGSPVLIVTEHLPGGLFGDRGEAVAACVYSNPPTRWSRPMIELTRLVRIPEYTGILSKLVAFATGKALSLNPIVVSFADWSEEHHGGIYQACGWQYHGQNAPQNDGLIIDGVFVPGRTCNARYGTRSQPEVQKQLPRSTVEKHFDCGKHLYWRCRGVKGNKWAKELNLQKNAYPKPKVVTNG